MSEQQESLELEKTPGGWRGKLTGQNISAIIMAVAMGVGAWMLVEHRQESHAAIAKLEATQGEALKSVAAALERNAEEQAVMNYILTLRPEEREKLRLDMPRSLRERIR